MDKRIDILKGIHPGLFLQRELGSRKIKSCKFAETIGEHPQTLSAIIRGRRSMNTSLSLRIELALGLEEGFLMTLQVFYDIEQEKRKNTKIIPDISKFTPTLFWDTSIERINWLEHSRYVINRVFERGTEDQIKEVLRFYGREKILEMIDTNPRSPFNNIIINNLKLHLNYDAYITPL